MAYMRVHDDPNLPSTPKALLAKFEVQEAD